MHIVRLSNIPSKINVKKKEGDAFVNFLQSNTRCAIGDIIGEIDEELRETTFRSGVVAKNG